MPALKMMLAAMGGAAALGTLAANAVPTRMHSAGGESWRGRIPVHAAADTSGIEQYTAGPEDLTPSEPFLGYYSADAYAVRYPDPDPVPVPSINEDDFAATLGSGVANAGAAPQVASVEADDPSVIDMTGLSPEQPSAPLEVDAPANLASASGDT